LRQKPVGGLNTVFLRGFSCIKGFLNKPKCACLVVKTSYIATLQYATTIIFALIVKFVEFNRNSRENVGGNFVKVTSLVCSFKIPSN
jgi:hypothetical protein